METEDTTLDLSTALIAYVLLRIVGYVVYLPFGP